MFGANFVILAQMYEELLRGQAKIPIILSQNGLNGQNDLEGQDLWPLFSILTKSIPWCMIGVNLVSYRADKVKFTDILEKKQNVLW